MKEVMLWQQPKGCQVHLRWTSLREEMKANHRNQDNFVSISFQEAGRIVGNKHKEDKLKVDEKENI